MKRLFPFAAVAVVILIGADGATAGELPTYELMGFPITAHQFSVVGSAGIQESSPVPTLMFGDMPASPHQIAVLSPRSKNIEALAANQKLVTVGFAPH
ncbi:hypothetical protein [Bradyrhizobium liaoningense]|uniref:hypothetical protein n=1 Tax=Bradyrhizobium liaoningense TaxID=43992 RepID=UPI001BA6A745|nr:hypothetical protein [Bradyrhizobium liaoningense]MBR0719819.1 hypothetical protein [Bradyrhizobium liaoningense]